MTQNGNPRKFWETTQVGSKKTVRFPVIELRVSAPNKKVLPRECGIRLKPPRPGPSWPHHLLRRMLRNPPRSNVLNLPPVFETLA